MKTIKMENRIKMVIPLLLIIGLLASGSTTVPPISPQGMQSSSITIAPVPSTPGKEEKILVDANSSSKASEKRALTGDNFLRDLYERPFTSKAMNYQPDVDILTASITKDANYFYFKIKLDGLDPKTSKLTADYGIEFDLNKDGRGDYLVWVKSPAKDWSTDGVTIYTDPNGDVGGKFPMTAEAGFSGNGYDNVMAVSGDNSSFSRIAPENPKIVEIAVSRKMLGDPKEFLWNAWADAGLRDPQKFDYNDVIGLSAAGSPIKSNADYPLNALFSVDNTCRTPYGFSSTVGIPGVCISAPPKSEPNQPGQSIPGIPPITHQ
jgi:hypothetical protein